MLAIRPLALLGAVVALLSTAFFAVSELATLRGAKAHDASAFLTRELGAPRSTAALVRKPAPGVTVSIHHGGFRLAAPEGTLTLTAAAAGSSRWHRYEHGALRRSPVGQEAVTVSGESVEESLRVLRRHGKRTWRWRLDTQLQPRAANGYVGFFSGHHLVPLELEPVRILDDAGNDVTPSRAHWSVARRHGAQWLELVLDDSKLPVPYTIDPQALRTSGAVATAAAAGTLTLTIPNTVRANDLLVMHAASRGGTTPSTTATGWAAIANAGRLNATAAQNAWWKKAASGDANTTVAVTVGAAAAGHIDVIKGADTSQANPFPQTPAGGTNNSNVVPCPAITTTVASEFAICLGAVNNSATWPATAGTYALGTTAANGTNVSSALYWDDVPTASTIAATNITAAGTAARAVSSEFGITPDATNGPTHGTITLGSVSPSGSAFYGNSRVYYNGNAGGSFVINDPITDAESAAESVTYPAVTTTGWTPAHGAETVTTASSFTSSTYTWTAGAAAPSNTETTLVAKDGFGNATNLILPFANDSAAPTGGALTVNATAASAGGTQSYNATGSFTIGTRTDYAETQSTSASGLASSTLTVQSASFTSADACGPYGSATTIVGSPAQSGLATGCYKYTLTGTDNVGNATSISTVVKVDTSAPSAPTLTLSTATGGAYYPASGSRVYFKPDASGGGSFAIGANESDSESGVASTGYNFPSAATIGTNWSVSGSGSSRTYSYTATATSSGTQTVSETNRAGLTGSTSSFDVTADSTAPSGGALTVNGTAASSGGSQSYNSTGSFAIGTRTDWSETQSATASGVASSTLTREQASFTSADTCGTYGSPTTLVGAPAQTGLTTGCYRYKLTGTDNVGNTVTLTTVVKVDTSAPSTPGLTLSNATGGGYYPGSGSRVYFKPDATGGGGFDISASSTDNDSGVASYSFPTGATIGTNWSVSGSGATRSYSYTATATTSGTQSVTATNNAGLTSGSASFDVTSDSTAPAGGALTVNGTAATSGGSQSYNSTGSFTIGARTDYTETQSATASGLASSTLTREAASFTSADTCGSYGTPTTIVGSPAQSGLATGCYRYKLTGTDLVGNTVTLTTVVKVDTSAPSSPTLTLSNATGAAYYPGSGTRVYFRPGATGGGGFDLSASSTDSDSGVASYSFPTGATVGTNWSASGTGSSRTYSYTPTATTTGTQSVTATNNAGLTSGSGTFDVTSDSTAPTGGALTVNGTAASSGGSQSYDGDGAFTIGTRTDYAESQTATASGLASSTLTREAASFTSADTCGSYGAPTTLVGSPAQSGLATGCYRYKLTGTDYVGNTVTITTVVKVDTSAPSAPTLSFANVTGGAYYPGSGTRVYFKPDAASGGFDLTASSTDSDSGVASYQFPTGATVGTNWSASGSGATKSYSYTPTASTTGSQSVTATNNTGLVSGGGSFDVTADSTAPAGGALTVNGSAASAGGTSSYDTDGSFAIDARTDYTETQSATASGLASSTLVRASASYSAADVCGTFGSPTTISGNPAQSGLATGCYRYTLTGTDYVGNSVSISTIVKVDTSAPAQPTLSFSSVTGGAYYPASGTRVYFKPNATGGGSFDLTASSTDSDTGVASYQFPSGATVGTNWSFSGSGATRTYSYTPTATTNGTQSVTATNNAGGISTGASFDVTADSTAPAGGALTVDGTAATGGGSQSYDGDGSFTIGTRTDYTETQSATASGLASSVLTRQSAAFSSADTCGTFGSSTTLVGSPAQSGLTTGCYRYTLTGTDNVGNTVSISTIVKVDTSGPSTPTLTLANATGGAYYSGSGTRVFFRPAAANGSFDVFAASSDSDTGVASYSFPTGAAIGTNWSVSGSGASRTYSYTATAGTNGPQNVSATNLAGVASANAAFDVTADATAPTGGALTVNGTAATGGGTSSYDADGSFTIGVRSDYGEAASATESGLASSTLTRESASFSSADTCGSFGSPTTLTGTPVQAGLSTGCYRYTLTGTDNVGNSVSIVTIVKVDTSGPSTPTLTLANATGGAYYPGSGSTVYFLPGAASGSFDVGASSTDSDTGVASYQFPTAAAIGANWTASGSGSSRTYSFTPTATTNGSQNVTATNNAGGVSASASFSVTADTTAPTTTVQCNGAACIAGYYTSSPVAVTLAGNDSTGSGVDKIRYTTDGTDPTPLNGSDYTGAISVNTTTTVKFRAYDKLGNEEAVGSQTILLDGTPPTGPALTLSENPASGAQHVSGSTLFYRPGASGTFRVAAVTDDPETGVTQVAFPSITGLAGGSTQASAPYREDYSWNATTSDNGSHNVVATNGASATSSAGFTMTPDSTAPTGQAITLTGGSAPYFKSASVTFSLADGNDGSGSGVDASTRTVTRETGDLAGDSCTSFGADAGTFTSPDTSVSGGHCYRYTFTVEDNVGNVSTAVTATAKVDTVAPTVSVTAPTEVAGAGNQYYDAATKTQYFRPGASGSFTLNATAADADTDISGVAFPNVSGTSGWSGSTGGTDASSPYSSPVDYSWSTGASEPGAKSVTATDRASNSSSDTIALVADSAAPTGQAITLTGGSAPYATSASVSFSLTDGSDSGAGLDPSSRSVTRETGDLAGNSCSNFSADAGTFTSPDTAVSGGHCYRYTFTIADRVGNVSSPVTATAKVDTTAPSTPSLSFGAFTNAAAVGGTVFFRAGQDGGFTVSSSSTDAETGVASTAFPSLGSGWTNTGGAYSFDSTATAPSGTQTVTSRNGAGTDSAAATFSVVGDATAPTTSAQCNGAACSSGWYTSAPVSFTLSATDGTGSGVDKIRYTTDGSDPTLLNGSDYTAAVSVASTTTVKFRAYDAVGNVEAVGSQLVQIDTSAPSAPSLALTESSPYEYVNGSELFFNPTGSNSGSFSVDAATSSPSGIQKVNFPGLAGMTGGGDDVSSPYQGSYSWTNTATTSPGSADVTAYSNSGLTNQSSFTVTKDTTAPTGQTLTLTGANAPYYKTTSVTFSLGDGSDSGAGLDTSSRTVTRESANLSGDSCGSFSADAGTFTSPDTSVSAGHCYRYTFTIADRVGNASSAVTVTAKVDSVAPSVAATAPTEISGGGSQYYDSTSKTQYFRSTGSGSFDLNATASDADTAVTGVAFPDLGGVSGWSGAGGTDTTSPYSSSTYSWSAGASEPGAKSVTATDKATNSAGDTITIADDTTGPSGQAIALTGANAPYSTTASVSFSLTDGSDSGAGVDTASRTVTRETGDLAGNSCSNFSADAGTFTSPDTSVSGGHCYRYTFTIADRVGNVSSPVTATAKVDTTAPSTPSLSFGSFTNASASGSTVFFRAGQTGSFTVSGSSTDAETGVSSTSFPSLGAGWTNTGGAYSFDPTATAPSGNQTVTSRNGAGTDSAAASFSVVADTTPPTTTTQCNGAACSSGWYATSPVSVTLAATDGTGSGVAKIRYTTDGSDPTLLNGSDYTAAISVASTTTVKFRAYDAVGNVEAVGSQLVQIDTTPPSAPSLTLNESSPYEHVNGSELFYNPSGTNSGSFAVDATTSDSQSGIQKVGFPALAGMTGGGDDATPPYQGSYSWNNTATTSPGSVDVTSQNNSGLTAQSSFTVTKDTTAPTGQTLTLTGADAPYSKTASVSFSTGDGSDSGAGLDTTSRAVRRETANLSGDSCGSFSADAGTFTSPDTSVSGGHCYRYTFTVGDNVGNTSSPVTVTAKVDTAAPSVSATAPTEVTGAGSQYYDSASKTQYFRSTGSGSFALNATASDSDTAVTGVTFPDLGGVSGWSGSGGTDTTSPYTSSTYSWSAGASDPGAKSVTATDKATNTGNDTITITDDTTAPSGQAITLTGANAPYSTTASVSFGLTDGSDGGAGLDTASRSVTRETGDLTGNSCSNFTADAGTFASPDTSVSGGHCYRYTFTIADRVGNVSTPVTVTAKVDTTAPAAPTLSFSALTNAYVVGSTVFYAPSAASGSFTVTASSSDAESGVASYTLPAAATGWTRSISGASATYSHAGAPTDPAEPNDVSATNGAGTSGASTSFAVTPDGAAPTTTPQCNGAACSSGWYTSSPVSVTLGATDGTGAGVDRIRYTTDGSDPTLLNGSDYTAAISVGSTTTVKFRAYDNLGNTEAVGSQLVRIDTSAPAAPTLTVDESSPYEDVNGTELFYNPSGTNAGTFTVDATTSDAQSGIQKVDFPSLTGMTGGGDDTGSPYQGSYSWNNAATASPGSADVTAHNGAGLTAQSSFTVTKDANAPTGGSVDYPNGFQTTTSVTITTADGNDGGGAGVDAASGVIDRRTATLTGGTCGPYSSWATVTSPDTVASGLCATYRYRVSDKVGNEAVYTSAKVVKVDTSAPAAPTLTVTESSPYEYAGGTTLYYNPSGSNSGSFTVAASASDAQSGIAQVDFPAVFGGDSATQASGPYSQTYSWTGGASASGAKAVSATNGAGASATADFAVTPDTTAPSGGTFGYADGYTSTGSVTITTPSASDGGAGVDGSSAVLERQTATLANGSCGSYGSWSAVTSPDTVGNGLCAVFRYRVSDRVGNEQTYTSANVVKVDSTGPSASLTDPGTPLAGTITLAASAADALSAVQDVTFQRSPAGANTWTTIGTDATAPYTASWNTTLVGDGNYDLRVVATDVVGNTTTSSVVANRRVDNTAPNTTIDSFPPDPDSDSTPMFTFSSTEGGSTFECRVDGGSWAPCSSPHTTAALTEGSRTFDVRATDPAGNTDQTPASRTWTLDLTPPTATWNSPASGASVSGAVTLDASSEPGATVAYSYSPASANTWTATTASWNTVPLADGSYDLRAIATDPAGNPSTPAVQTNVKVDNHAPTLTITAPTTYVNASDPNPLTITASSPDADLVDVRFYECSDASTACGTGSWSLIATDTTAPYSASWNVPASDGKKAIRAVGTDGASNTGASVKTITIDRTAPTGVTVSYPGGYAAGAVTITTGNGPDPDVAPATGMIERQTATLTNDSCGSFGSWSTVTSPDAISSGQCAKYRYSVADNAGNVATATSAATVKRDTVAPSSTQDDPGANLRLSVALTASASDSGGAGVSSVAFQRRPNGGSTWTTIGSDSTAPYSVSFDTTTVGDGLYDFRTVATDAAGNAETSPTVVASRRIDNTPPSAAMLTPADGGRVRGTVNLTASTSDGGSGIDTTAFELAPVPGAFASVASPWDTSSVMDGDYRLHVVATDKAGNTTTSSAVTTTVDNTPPSLIFSSPAAGSAVKGTVALTATANDASPANPAVTFAYKLHADPASAYAATTASWNTAALAAGDGLYDVRASATDAAGNSTQVVNANILVDNQPPAISITSPPATVNSSVSSPAAFDATATDGGSGVQQVDFYECSNTSNDCSTGTWNLIATDTTSPYGVSWTIPSDGNHALRALAKDNAGHTSAAVRNVTVDRTAPNTTITATPANPSNAAATFTFTSNEPASTFECAIDGGAWSPCTSPKTFTGLADGTHTVDVRATDAAGNVEATPDSWTWLRDTTDPTATIGDPGNNVRATVTLTSTQSDPGGANASGVATVQFEYSGNGGTTWAATPASWNTAAVTDGLYKVHVVVTDNAGNKTTVPVGHDVRVDNTAPTTSQDDPGQFLRATKTISGSASDAGSGVDHVDFQRSPAGAGTWTTVGTDSTSPYSTSFDTTSVGDGRYDFRTVAYDVAGNQAGSSPVPNRLVDNTAPNATMSDPGPYLRGTVTLTSATSDPNGTNGSGVASVAYEYSTDGGTTWLPTTASFNTAALADGNVKLHVVATDNAGNVGTSSDVTDLVDNTKPTTTDDAPATYRSSAVTVTLSPADAGSGVNVTEYAVDGGSFSVGTSVTIPAPSDGSNDGAHTIAYFSADNAGNVEQVKSTTVLIDATPPTCPSCSAADYLRGTVTLSASPTSGASGIKSVKFEYSPAGAATWTTIGTDTTGPAPYTVSWNTTLVADGHYDLRIIVTDNANTSTTTNLPDKVVDNTQPNVATVGAPTEGATVSGNVNIAASAADVTSPVASVEFLVRGVSVGTDTTAPYSLAWNSASGPDGSASIQVTVTDMAGNARTSAVRTISVDNGAPSPTLADPGQYLSGGVDLTATSDPDTAQVEFQRSPAGAGTWTTIATDTSAPYAASFDTTALSDGLYDFRVRAVDSNGNSGTSAVRASVRIDNTAPTGSLTAPAAGATVGGPGVDLAASTSDGGSGVASVRYEYRATGGGSFTTIATATSSPFGATWNTTGLASGTYDLRPVITDRAGNSSTRAAVTVTVDAAAPTVTLADPGASVSGTVQLSASVSGSGATRVTFGYSRAGANSWTAIASDTSAPYTASLDTSTLGDGLYDLRAVVYDGVGNTSQSVRSGIRIDNTAPRLVSSSPGDGTRVDDASSIELVASEAATATDVALDGGSTVAPVISGTHITYGTGALAAGAHTLAGELKDASGKTAPFRVHFTVWKSGSEGVAPMIEKNTSAVAATSLTSADAFARATMPAGAWTPQGRDWLVLRVKPLAAPVSLTNGFGPAGEAVDVEAYWALAGGQVHEFGRPLEILLPNGTSGLVPATSEGTGWRVLRHVPDAPALPGSWEDGFYADAAGFHILSRHLTLFTLLRDLEAPLPPTNVLGFAGAGGLTLKWTPGEDNSGTYAHTTVFADGASIGTYAAGTEQAGVGANDTRAFTLTETDLAGNESVPTKPLVRVPAFVGKTPEEAAAALEAAGFHAGAVVEGGTGAPGTISGPANLVLAEPGATIDLTVASGTGAPAPRLSFGVVTAPTLKAASLRAIPARVSLTRAARVTAVLRSPRNLKLYTWKFALRAGRSIVTLKLPTQVRRPGVYTIRWTATAGRDVRTKTVKIRLVGRGNGVGAVVAPRANPVEIVLAGSGLGDDVTLGSTQPKAKLIAAAAPDRAFDLAGASSRNVQVIVVDVDEFGVGFVRDLHTVFPQLRIVALSKSSETLAAARRNGATVALPRSTPPATLAKVIAKLLKRG